MKLRLVLERAVLILSIFVLAGTNRCREDYFFATQSNISATVTGTVEGTTTVKGTTTATPTETPEPDQATETPTVTATATVTPKVTSNSLLNADFESTAGKRVSVESTGILSELATLDKPDAAVGTRTPASSTKQNLAGTQNQNLDSNWLGGLYDKSQQNEDQDSDSKKVTGADADKDGYSDNLEELERSDPHNPNSFPEWIKSTKLSQRFQGIDDDADGVNNEEEASQGTNPSKQDSDADGISDGAEKLSGSNPLNPQSLPLGDTDGDGLSDDYERAQGTNPKNFDTDRDGASDSVEAALGTNPLVSDSDSDGISDGREVQTGSDPLLPDNK